MKTAIINNIEQNLIFLKEKVGIPKEEGLDSKWTKRASEEPGRFINPDLTIRKEALINFRRNQIFVLDVPSFNPSALNIKNILGGGRRGCIRLLLDDLALLKKLGCTDLLKKYPTTLVGNPYVFKKDGYIYTYRWVRQIYYLWLFKKVLAQKIRENFVALDIGSSYGILSYLLNQEFPRSHSMLLDLTGQLVMAHYFLALSYPEAKIAGFKDIANAQRLDREFFEKYDFILMPWFLYKKITPGSIDIISNFGSFGEMMPKWIDYYLKGEPFVSTKYFFTANRFESAPDFDTGLTILDYPFEGFRRLHFGICPVHSHLYVRKNLFFYEKKFRSSQYFEFIGERKT